MFVFVDGFSTELSVMTKMSWNCMDVKKLCEDDYQVSTLQCIVCIASQPYHSNGLAIRLQFPVRLAFAFR